LDLRTADNKTQDQDDDDDEEEEDDDDNNNLTLLLCDQLGTLFAITPPTKCQ
jgi:hypothetical protein